MQRPEALYIHNASHETGNRLECSLCPHHCSIAESKSGFCAVRYNSGGKAELPYYGAVSALAVDPVEKKPLYHFRPGTEICSVGFYHCNLRCPFCQNWQIAQPSKDYPGSYNYMSPQLLLDTVLDSGTDALAFTYSEPLIHIEYLIDTMTFCRKAGICVVLVTNGTVSADAAEHVLSLCDAVNIDIKTFSEEKYKSVLKGDLNTVLDFTRTAVKLSVHTEITSLIIPDFNDTLDEMKQCRDFIANLSMDIPWHLSAYHPAFTWNKPATKSQTIKKTADMAREKLHYVYCGNIPDEQGITRCLSCGHTLVSRKNYHIDCSGLKYEGSRKDLHYFCANCAAKAPFSAGKE